MMNLLIKDIVAFETIWNAIMASVPMTSAFCGFAGQRVSSLRLSMQTMVVHAMHLAPQHIAENILNRQFHADKPNEKWLTDVTEFKYYVGPEVHKVYLSAILDLCDRRIVSFIIRDSNDLPLVFDTLNAAVKAYPNAHPLFHSDRGFQYTHRGFHQKLEEAGMKQSMSRIGKCIDNGPMEGFWGLLKRERYYGRRFTSREELVEMIEDYIAYYNSRRLQRNLGVLTPMEKYAQFLAA